MFPFELCSPKVKFHEHKDETIPTWSTTLTVPSFHPKCKGQHSLLPAGSGYKINMLGSLSLLSQTDHFIATEEIKLPWESLHVSRGVP